MDCVRARVIADVGKAEGGALDLGDEYGFAISGSGDRCKGVFSKMLSSCAASDRIVSMVGFLKFNGFVKLGLSCITVLAGLEEPISPSLEPWEFQEGKEVSIVAFLFTWMGLGGAARDADGPGREERF